MIVEQVAFEGNLSYIKNERLKLEKLRLSLIEAATIEHKHAKAALLIELELNRLTEDRKKLDALITDTSMRLRDKNAELNALTAQKKALVDEMESAETRISEGLIRLGKVQEQLAAINIHTKDADRHLVGMILRGEKPFDKGAIAAPLTMVKDVKPDALRHALLSAGWISAGQIHVCDGEPRSVYHAPQLVGMTPREVYNQANPKLHGAAHTSDLIRNRKGPFERGAVLSPYNFLPGVSANDVRNALRASNWIAVREFKTPGGHTRTLHYAPELAGVPSTELYRLATQKVLDNPNL